MTTPITLTGNITNDPRTSFTQTGKQVTSFTVAVNERYKNQAGEWVDGDTTFYDCNAWNDLAENAAESLTKGMRVIVTGGLKARQWETKDGEKRTSLDVTVSEVGPSLRWATAVVTRTGSTNRQQQSAPPANDPWMPQTDDPPF